MSNRRKFILNGLAALGVITIGHQGYKALSPFENTVANLLNEDLWFLKITQKDIDQFASDLEKTNALGFGLPQKTIIKLYANSYLKNVPLPYMNRYIVYRNEIVGRFLLSTDFFLNKMDESKPVKYMGKIWSPYTTPCMHPFSSMYYTTKTP